MRLNRSPLKSASSAYMFQRVLDRMSMKLQSIFSHPCDAVGDLEWRLEVVKSSVHAAAHKASAPQWVALML
eukprot:756424-Pelagomonas_calceolata.AAC.12